MYAVVIHFDKEATSILNRKIEDIAILSENRYMLDTGIAPHITIGAFNSDNEAAITEIIDNFAKNVSSGIIDISEIGCFKPHVVFASPVKNEYLINLNYLLNEMVSGKFEVADNEHYIPKNWTPHCTLATKLNEQQFEKAVIEAEKIALPLLAKATELALAECNPYKELAVWKLI